MSNAEKLKKYKLFRQTEISRLTTIYNTAKLAEQDENHHVGFKMMMDDVPSIQSEFFKTHNAIIGLIDGDDAFAAEDAIRQQFEHRLYSVRTINYNLFSQASVPVSQTPVRSHIKLPKIDLQTFSGDITTFISFIDMFDSIIHSSAELTPIEKFN